MKAISIKQPWASLIAHGIKDIENRTWKTHFRGRIYIHASAKSVNMPPIDLLTREQQKDILAKYKNGVFPWHHPLSAIIGEVDIIDCVINHPSVWAEKTTIHIENGKMYSNEKPTYNWVLANAKLYDKPILNVKGKLSFWEPDDLLVECIACGDHLRLDDAEEDSAGERYHEECYKELAPIMDAEYKEMKRKGEI